MKKGEKRKSRSLLHNGPRLINKLNRKDTKMLCCRCFHKRRTSPLTCLAICFLVLTYNLLGGFIFLALEGYTEEVHIPSKPNHQTIHSKTVERLWSITEDLNILYKENWTKLAAKELVEFQKVLLDSLRSDTSQNNENNYHWTFSGSFFYALTLITTIGNANVIPKSLAGKIVSMAYASLGIPIIMLYLSTLGETFARKIRALYSKFCPDSFKNEDYHSESECLHQCSHFSKADKSIDRKARDERRKRTPFQAALNLDSLSEEYHWTCRDHTRVPIFFSLLLIALYITVGTFIFKTTENWNFIDGCYFAFTSLSTIGFGYMKPGLYASTISPKTEDFAIGACCIYILVGMVVIATCFNLIHEDVRLSLRGLTSFCMGSSKSRAVYNIQANDETIAVNAT